MTTGRPAVLDRDGLTALVSELRGRGYEVIAPVVRDGAVVLGPVESIDELPEGRTTSVEPGRVRLERGTGELFGCATADSWKRFLQPPRQARWTWDGERFTAADEPVPRYALLGVHACDLAAIAVLTRVRAQGAYPDPRFVARCDQLFVVAATCTRPGALCFCASAGTGPRPGAGFDLELVEFAERRFLATTGSDAGAQVLAAIPHRPARPEEEAAADRAVEAATGAMGRTLPDTDLPTLLEHARSSELWSQIADRCLACGNCTAVCPTCFCTTPEDRTDASGPVARREERSASCFELAHSYVHGGCVHATVASRYRQWVTHKFGTWVEQFGTSGCVGCGRCIAWCPAGIDVTAELGQLAAADEGVPGAPA